MSKATPVIYMLGVFFGVAFVWYIDSESRLFNLTWSLPGLLAGTFGSLWNVIAKLERRIAKLEQQLKQAGNYGESK